MANWKAIGTGVGIVVVVVLVGVGIWVKKTVDTDRNAAADDTTPLAQAKGFDPALIRKGAYVMRAGDCAACHTAGAGSLSGGYAIKTPFGTLESSNITPDVGTGIGKMTERDFFNAMREGQGSKGFLYPAMPYTSYTKMTDGDLHALWAYLSTVKPVSNEVDENAGMTFPYNQRIAVLGWDMLYFSNTGFDGDAIGTDRGRYLVDAAGHCSACHTPRNALGGEIAAKYLQGSKVDGWYAPDISSDPHQGVGDMTAEQIAEYLGTGSDGISVAAGPMGEAVQDSLQYLRKDDLLAMASYLKTVQGSGKTAPAAMPASSPEMKVGSLEYEVSCSACHGVNGEGMGGFVAAFKDNHTLMADDPTNVVRSVLTGARAAHTQTKPTGAGMPSFAWKYSNAQIAEVINYIRNSWGNAAVPVTAETVAAERKALAARDALPAPATLH